jgi:hypothetical protein
MCPIFIVNELQMVGSILHVTVTQTLWKLISSSKVDTENARVHAIQHSDLISLKEVMKQQLFFSLNALKDVFICLDLLSWNRYVGFTPFIGHEGP